MISNHKLHHVVTLAEHGNFGRAADALNLTQPALTRSIQSLEQTLGAKLFDRRHGGTEPTGLGSVVIDRARQILTGVAELEHEIELLHGLGAGTLEVSLGPYPSALSGKPALAKFVAAHPEVQCRVRVAGYGQVSDDVKRGHCEVGIADLEPAVDRGLTTEVLVERPVYFFARPRHPLVARRRCTVADVLEYPWAATRMPRRASRYLPDHVGRAGHWDSGTGEFVPSLEADVVSDLLDLAHESDILAAATLTMAENDLTASRLAVVRFRPSWLRLHYGFIARPNRTLSRATLEFMDIVRGIEAELEERETALRRKYL